MPIPVIELAKVLFSKDGHENIAGFLKHLKQYKLNNDNGPTLKPKYGDPEVGQLISYFITVLGDILYNTIFMPNNPFSFPIEYMKDTMQIAAYRFSEYPQLLCCASGDIIALRKMYINGKEVLIPFYVELKIAKKPINGNHWVTASIPKSTLVNFHGKTIINGRQIECPHLYILVPKVINASQGKICIVNATELRKLVNTLKFTTVNTDEGDTEILLYEDIPKDPNIIVELNDWVAEQETEKLFNR